MEASYRSCVQVQVLDSVSFLIGSAFFFSLQTALYWGWHAMSVASLQAWPWERMKIHFLVKRNS